MLSNVDQSTLSPLSLAGGRCHSNNSLTRHGALSIAMRLRSVTRLLPCACALHKPRYYSDSPALFQADHSGSNTSNFSLSPPPPLSPLLYDTNNLLYYSSALDCVIFCSSVTIYTCFLSHQHAFMLFLLLYLFVGQVAPQPCWLY